MSDATQIDWARVSVGFGGIFAQDEETQAIHCFAPAISGRLVIEGVIYQREGRWRIRHEDAYITEQYPQLAICDFCSGTPVKWFAACDSFQFYDGGWSTGPWACCDGCGRAVQENRRKDLLYRVKKRQALADFTTTLAGFDVIADQHERFWRHYRGAVAPVQP